MPELISRQQFLRDIKAAKENGDMRVGTAKTLRHYIKQQPTVDAVELHWIPATERLPGSSLQRVLVVVGGAKAKCLNSSPNIDTDRWFDGRWVRWGEYVTHWMPLPELPTKL